MLVRGACQAVAVQPSSKWIAADGHVEGFGDLSQKPHVTEPRIELLNPGRIGQKYVVTDMFAREFSFGDQQNKEKNSEKLECFIMATFETASWLLKAFNFQTDLFFFFFKAQNASTFSPQRKEKQCSLQFKWNFLGAD